MRDKTRTTSRAAVSMARLLVAYYILYIMIPSPVLSTQEKGHDGGPKTTACQVTFVSSSTTDRGNHREDYHVTSGAQDGGHVCEVQVKDILCKEGCQYNDPDSAFYPVLTCDEKAHLQVAFTNPERITKEIVTFLQLHHCSVSLLDVGVLGQAVWLVRAKVDEATIMDQGSPVQIPAAPLNIVPGLGDMKSLTYHSRQGDINTIPHYLYTHKWPNMTSMSLTGIYATASQTNSLVRAMPRLSFLSIKHSNISIVLNVPDDPQDRRYKSFVFENNNIGNLSYLSITGRLSKISLVGNKIKRLEEDTFWEVLKLRSLTLASNLLTELPEGLFRNASLLEYLDLSHNNIVKLSPATFTGIHYLEILRLNNNNLHKITSFTFDFHHLELLDLSHNNIHAIEEYALPFGNTKKGLRNLILASNLLPELPSGLFRNLSGLENLDLSYNNISNLSQGTFTGIHKLKSLKLNNNRLHAIPRHTFYDFHHLELLDLSNNAIYTIENEAIVYGKGGESLSLNTVNLQHNRLTHFPAWIFTTASVRAVDLSDNLLSFPGLCMDLDGINMEWVMNLDNDQPYKVPDKRTVNLRRNNFTVLDVNTILDDGHRRETFKKILNFFWLDLADNNVVCDCQTFTMAEFLRVERQKLISSNDGKEPRVKEFYFENWRCSQPMQIAVVDMVKCTEDVEGCPLKCSCERMVSNGPITVDCSNRSMTTLPETVPNRTVTLKLDHNAIEFVDNTKYLSGITNLDLSQNHIKKISDAAIESFDKLWEVNLNHNHLEHIPYQFKKLQHVQLRLAGNYFICDCDEAWAVTWLRSYRARGKIPNIDDVLCAPGIPKLASKAIYKGNVQDFVCELSKETIKAIAITIGVVMSLMFILLILVYTFRGEIKLCLYFHLKWHPFDRNDDADITDKLYDAFVSYNKADTHWVINTLKPAMENAEKPYRLCIHERDFKPGGLVTDNVLFSVKYSRRMILILTKNFLKSEWCTLEFISAHRRVLKERTNYLIVILFDGLDIDGLDEHLKLYLKTNTYIEHDSRWFWQRLHYAMPEKPLAVIKQDPYPPEGYGTLFPSPKSLMTMHHIDKEREKMYEQARNGEVLIV